MRWPGLAAAAALVCFDTAHAAGFVYKFSDAIVTDLGVTTGDVASGADDINDLGDIVGGVSDGDGYSFAFIILDGVTYSLHGSDSPSVHYASAHGINDSRQVVGAYMQSGQWHGFYYYPGIWLTQLPETVYGNSSYQWETVPQAINASGRIAGTAERMPSWPLPPETDHACFDELPVVWANFYNNPMILFCITDPDHDGQVASNATPRGYDINDSGHVVGADAATSPHSMFVFKNGHRHPVPTPAGMSRTGAGGAPLHGVARGINNKGWVVGWYGMSEPSITSSPRTAFAWDGVSADSISLGRLSGGTRSSAYEINEQNMVAGTSTRKYGNLYPSAAFIWHKDFGMKQLPALSYGSMGLSPYDCEATSLNNLKNGVVQVVGNCKVNGTPRAVRWDVSITKLAFGIDWP